MIYLPFFFFFYHYHSSSTDSISQPLRVVNILWYKIKNNPYHAHSQKQTNVSQNYASKPKKCHKTAFQKHAMALGALTINKKSVTKFCDTRFSTLSRLAGAHGQSVTKLHYHGVTQNSLHSQGSQGKCHNVTRKINFYTI
jgi:hypothetical protein